MTDWPEAVERYARGNQQMPWEVRRDADAAIAALKERWEECERRFDLVVEKCERMIARAEQAEAEVRAQAKLLKQLAAEVRRLAGAERALARVMAENTANYDRAEQAEAKLLDELAKNALTPTGRERLEQAEAKVKMYESTFPDLARSGKLIHDLKAEVERQQRGDGSVYYENKIEALQAEVERLKWMLDDICARADTGTMYGPMPWVSRDEMLADLAARYEKEQP